MVRLSWNNAFGHLKTTHRNSDVGNFIMNCLFNVEQRSETKIYTSIYIMQLRWMFLWDLKRSEFHDDHNMQIKKKNCS